MSVITGNRWAADSDKDLYIILYGDIDKSSKCALRQDVSKCSSIVLGKLSLAVNLN